MDGKLLIFVFFLPSLINGQQNCDDFGTAEYEANPECAIATPLVHIAVQTLGSNLSDANVTKFCSEECRRFEYDFTRHPCSNEQTRLVYDSVAAVACCISDEMFCVLYSQNLDLFLTAFGYLFDTSSSAYRVCSTFVNDGSCSASCAQIIATIAAQTGCCTKEYFDFLVAQAVVAGEEYPYTLNDLYTACNVQNPGECQCPNLNAGADSSGSAKASLVIPLIAMIGALIHA